MAERPPTERQCKKCSEAKPLDDFVKHSACKWGRTWTRKACDNADRREAEPNLPTPETDALLRECRKCGETKPLGEFALSPRSRYGRRHQCNACDVARVKRWVDADPERTRRHARERSRRMLDEAYDATRAKSITYMAVARGARYVEEVKPLIVLELADGVCGICGEDVDPFDFQMDHIVPCSQGGDHSYENVQAAHPGCNAQKSKEERKSAMARG